MPSDKPKRLTPSQVQRIRVLCDDGRLTYKEIGALFHIKPPSVSKIKNFIYYAGPKYTGNNGKQNEKK